MERGKCRATGRRRPRPRNRLYFELFPGGMEAGADRPRPIVFQNERGGVRSERQPL